MKAAAYNSTTDEIIESLDNSFFYGKSDKFVVDLYLDTCIFCKAQQELVDSFEIDKVSHSVVNGIAELKKELEKRFNKTETDLLFIEIDNIIN